MQIAHNAYVVVADGRKVLLLRNEGDEAYPNLVVESAEERINPPDGDQKTDQSGRAQSTRTPGGTFSAGGGTMGETDFHQQEEDRFAADTAAMLKDRALANDFEQLIIVAPPKTLGELRKHYHKAVSERLSGELAKDLTGHSVADIEKALAAA